jgi:folate-binding protein YgfZ
MIMSTLAFAPLSSRAVLALSGPDWRTFLQGLITQDVETLKPGELRFGALLTPQGRLIYDLFILGRPDGAWLDVPAEHRAALATRLTMYRLRAKVEIEPIDAVVAALFGEGPAPTDQGWATDPRLPALGFRAYGAAAPEGAAIRDEAAYEAHRLAVGAPGPADWGVEKTYPIEANFDLLGGIDFKKGCFVGQETTSRMKRRGQIKTRMLPVAFQGEAPAPGAEILAGELRAGQVLSTGDGRAMALLRLDRIGDGGLTVDGREVRVQPPAWMPAAAQE